MHHFCAAQRSSKQSIVDRLESVRDEHAFSAGGAAGLTPADLPKLKLKWAIGFPDAELAWSEPTVLGGRVFVGSQNGTIYSLDAKSGCIYWTFLADGGVRASVSIGPSAGPGSPYSAYFSDQRGNAYSLDATTGKLNWQKHVEDHPIVRLTGSPTLHDGRLYVPSASLEESQGGIPTYECCTFRGSITTLDARTGAVVWKTFMIPDEPRPPKKNAVGTTLWGPSGAGYLGSAGDRRQAGRHLRDHRQQLLRSDGLDIRRDHRARPEDGQDQMGVSGDRERRGDQFLRAERRQSDGHGQHELP